MDNGLSEKGFEQVEKLKKKYLSGELLAGGYFFSSPKKRCIETLQPLSLLTKKNLEIKGGLNEQGTHEDYALFLKRINSFIIECLTFSGSSSVLYLCSHGDVIPILIEQLTGKQVSVEKGKALTIAFDGKKWALL